MKRKPFRSKKKRLIMKQCKGKGILFFLKYYRQADLVNSSLSDMRPKD